MRRQNGIVGLGVFACIQVILLVSFLPCLGQALVQGQRPGGISAVTRPVLMQNRQVVARNFFAAGGVAIQPGQYVANPSNGQFATASPQNARVRQTPTPTPTVPSRQRLLLANGQTKGDQKQPVQSPAVTTLIQQAQEGSADAQFQLGMRYYSGAEVPQNKRLAQQWLMLSARNGNAMAGRALVALSAERQ